MDKEFINNPVEAYTRLNSLYNDNCEYTKKLEDTLQEIKAIAEEYLTDCQGFKCDAMEEIIQKITKVESEG